MALKITKKKWMWAAGGGLILGGLWFLIPELHQIPYVELVLKIMAVVAGVLILIDW